MIFIFKKPTLVLDCFTWSRSAYELLPIDYGYNHFPDWWKQLPRQVRADPFDIAPLNTTKTCPGIVHFHTKCIVLPMWCDLNIHISENNYEWNYSDSNYKLDTHPLHVQTEGWLDNSFFNIKFIAPWAIKCKTFDKFLQTYPIYSYGPEKLKRLIMAPGVVDFKSQHAVNVNTLGQYKKEHQYISYEAGEPLAFFFPLSDKKIKLKHHLVSKEDFNQLFRGGFVFNNITPKFLKFWKKNEDRF